jgi:hypothetical protein
VNRTRWISVAASVLAGLGLHPQAHAGGGASESSSGDASGSSDTGLGSTGGSDTTGGDGDTSSSGFGTDATSDSGGTTELGPCLSPLDDTAGPGDTGTGSSGVADDFSDDSDTGPCLSIAPPNEGCECGPADDPASPLALLLPVLALRRRAGRRERIDRLASEGRLPPDVIARLRARLLDGE